MPSYIGDLQSHVYTPGLPLGDRCACGKKKDAFIHIDNFDPTRVSRTEVTIRLTVEGPSLEEVSMALFNEAEAAGAKVRDTVETILDDSDATYPHNRAARVTRARFSFERVV